MKKQAVRCAWCGADGHEADKCELRKQSERELADFAKYRAEQKVKK